MLIPSIFESSPRKTCVMLYSICGLHTGNIHYTPFLTFWYSKRAGVRSSLAVAALVRWDVVLPEQLAVVAADQGAHVRHALVTNLDCTSLN